MPTFAILRFEPTNRPAISDGDSRGEKRQILDALVEIGDDRGHDADRAFTRHLHLRDYYRLATTLAEAVLFLPI